MEVIYLGHSSFKIKGKSATIITDPFDPQMLGLKYQPDSADIVTISHHHKDHDQSQLIDGAKKIIDGPGEYEISGVTILGYQTFHDEKQGADRGKNTIYIIEIDGFRIAHLGDLGHMPSDQLLSDIGDIDILMIPIGGSFTIDAAVASEIASKISPHVIIPMHFKVSGLADTFNQLTGVEPFVTNMGIKSETLPKLVVKDPASWGDEEQQIVILEKK